MKSNTGILQSGLLLAMVALAAPQAHAEFDKRWYIGLGGGVSFISPHNPNYWDLVK